jgi:hypothetical protein
VERFHFKNLSELEYREKYLIIIPNRFAALENLKYSESINGTWENVKENVKMLSKESLGMYEP